MKLKYFIYWGPMGKLLLKHHLHNVLELLACPHSTRVELATASIDSRRLFIHIIADAVLVPDSLPFW